MACKFALEHMTPVILLSEGFLGNGSEPWLIPDLNEYPDIVPPLVSGELEPGQKFQPFERDPQTLVPRWALPGMKGWEHRKGGLEKNHQGVLSNDPLNHATMVAERAEKVARIAEDVPLLHVQGEQSGKLLVVGWGGTYGHIASAFHDLRDAGYKVSYTHFDFINPLPKNTAEVLGKYKKVVVAEQNLGQLAAYLRSKVDGFVPFQFNQVKGQPFVVSELVENFETLLKAPSSAD
jgi:2-oxoglutarate ferredoxin oxidoreductase subunit alpha